MTSLKLFLILLFGFGIVVQAWASTAEVRFASGLNFRASPNGQRLGALAQGSRVRVIEKRGSWYKVRLPSGRQAYMFAAGLKLSSEAGTCTNCSRNDDEAVRHFDKRSGVGQLLEAFSYVGGRYAPIMKPFIRAFNMCAPGCRYENWGVWGDRRHQVRRSCHNSGSAIDIPAVTCGGRRMAAGSRGFNNFLACMRRQPNLYVIHGSGAHKKHADIALRSCQVGGKGKIRVR